MSSRTHFAIAVVTTTAILAVGIALRQRTPATDNTPTAQPPVSVRTAHVRDLTSATFTVTAPGTVASESEAAIVASVTGTITYVGAELSANVTNGQTLFRIDATGPGGNTDLEAARIQVDSAAKAYDDARRADEKTDSLTSKNTRDRARNAKELAELAYQDVLNRRIVTSPIGGTLTAKNVTVGDTVAPGTPLGTVSRGARIVRFYVSDDDRPTLSRGQTVTVQHAAGDTDTLEATITRIASVADPASRRFLIEATGNGMSLASLAPGTIVTVTTTVTRAAENGDLLVPITALSQDASGAAVFTLAGDTVTRRIVTIRTIYGDYARITGPGTADDVVVEGARLLHDGQTVTRR